MLLGAFQEGGQIGDLWIMVALGAAGWLMKATDTPARPSSSASSSRSRWSATTTSRTRSTTASAG
ncbi:hypothetical protein [Janibacter melonis]|uniref:hypothetical protein n=1 Tax=Janibacter melonis TaxID=262209 RepID=UPI0020951B0E|nr:hypothetical protein [Janibacter melonis]